MLSSCERGLFTSGLVVCSYVCGVVDAVFPFSDCFGNERFIWIVGTSAHNTLLALQFDFS